MMISTTQRKRRDKIKRKLRYRCAHEREFMRMYMRFYTFLEDKVEICTHNMYSRKKKKLKTKTMLSKE